MRVYVGEKREYSFIMTVTSDNKCAPIHAYWNICYLLLYVDSARM